MPQLPVHKFGGDCADWSGYNEAFTRLIHQNERLDTIQRFISSRNLCQLVEIAIFVKFL